MKIKIKKMMSKIKWGGLFVTMALTGCKTAEDLEASVNSRWQAIIGADLNKAYSYYSPGYKSVESLESFKVRISRAQLNIKWSQATFKGAECAEEGVCEVKVEVVYSFKFPKRSLGGVDNVPTQLTEQWIKVDGKWHHVPNSN